LHARYRMQKFISLFALLGLIALTAGCAGAAATELPSTLSAMNPSASSLEIHNQTELRLTEGNFSIVKTNVVGDARGFSLLGFITLVPARFETAMGRFYSKAEMQTGRPQTLGNLIVEKTSAYWILFSIPRVSVRADVLEFSQNHPLLLIPHSMPPGETEPSTPLAPQGEKSGGKTL
jgi:hypothetical protein